MDPLTYAIVAFVLVAAVTFLAGAVPLRRWTGIRVRPLTAPEGEVLPPSILRWEDEASTRWHRTVERIGQAMGPRKEPDVSRFRRRLAWAGYHNPRAVELFVGAKFAVALLFAAAYPLYGLFIQRVLPSPLPIAFFLGGAGFFLGDLWLEARIRARQGAIVRALPDVLDLLMVCVEAGMGFDAAVARVAQQPQVVKSPLHQELLRMHLEVRVGRPREEALRALADRTGVEEVKSMVGTFIQADRLGTSLGRTLRIHAESARVARRHRAEERAYLAPLKMLFPIVFFLLPSFFLVAMAPPLLRLAELFGRLGSRW
jgi:tight adherence protein C